MKKIGILGGISAASTVEYYTKILQLYYDMKHDYYYPEINIESLNFQYFTDLENQNNMNEYKKYILAGIANLERADCDVVIMSANSPHSVFPSIKENVKVPMISIVESVKKFALENGMKKLLLTGIKYTMKSTFYQEELSKSGIEVIVPSDEEKDVINNIIFGELAINIISPESQTKYLDILEKYAEHFDIDGVILGCTELPALADGLKCSVPYINSLELHCSDVLKYVLNT